VSGWVPVSASPAGLCPPVGRAGVLLSGMGAGGGLGECGVGVWCGLPVGGPGPVVVLGAVACDCGVCSVCLAATLGWARCSSSMGRGPRVAASRR
jgi:hypothetical protein